MNTGVDVIVEAAARPMPAFLGVRLLFEQQEERFSRFRPSSLLSALNRGDVVREPFFVQACHMAVEAHAFTGGIFNPMVLPALIQAGYSVSFDEVSGGAPAPMAVPDPRAALVFEDGAVRLSGGQVDLGGIIKGWTVDLGVGLLTRYCPDVFLNAGGDLCCTGSEADAEGRGWRVAVAARAGELPPWEGIMTGAIATSTTRKRRWTTASGGLAHHLIDPRTGMPAESPFDQVSCWAAETWRAEVWAKAVLIGGEAAAERAAGAGVPVLAIPPVGDPQRWGAPLPE